MSNCEREDADELAALRNALEEEQETVASLEDENAKLTKDRDLVKAKLKVLKREKTKLGDGHEKLVKDLDDLIKDYKSLESENSILIKSNEQLQARLDTYDIASSSNSSSCDHANLIEELSTLKEELSLYVETNEQIEAVMVKYGLNPYASDITCEKTAILEENVRLTKELAKFTTSKNKGSLDDLLSKQMSYNKKHGLGFAPKAYKKNNYKKEMPAQENNKKVTNDGKAPKGKATSGDHTGPNNHYVLFKDYYGDIYAKYDGPYDGYVAWSIWVPKTLVTNMRGPIAKQWVPKSKN